MDEPSGPESLRPAQTDCPRCTCCTAPLCARGQHNDLAGCGGHVDTKPLDEEHLEKVKTCPCSAATTKRTAAWRRAQIDVAELARKKPLLPPVEALLRALADDPMAPDPHSLFDGLERLSLVTRVHDLPALTPLGHTYLRLRDEAFFPTPVEVESVDTSTRSAQVVVVGWDIGRSVTVLLDQLTTATCLTADELPGLFLEAHANCRTVNVDDLVLTDITLAPPLPETFAALLEPAGGDGA
ncbi:hypothetical protein ACFY0G_17315 [Streptomyces sp. NPDC001552]|uniref:hypothetical protein n=1 Tax=Streptomyces sp. NPDC001552 TaxID=3364587 RepID=UPI00369D4F7F